jgi:Flp pilus assembly pilin Flp
MARSGQALVEYILIIALVAVVLLVSLVAFRSALAPTIGSIEETVEETANDCPPPGQGGLPPGQGGVAPGQCRNQ